MIIGIDGNEANTKTRVGIGQYAYQVLSHIHGMERQGKSDTFVVYLKHPPRSDMPKTHSQWRYSVFGPSPLWTQIALPLKLFLTAHPPEVFFTPSHYAPRFSKIPQVISIMDLSFVQYPTLFTKKDLYQLTRWTHYSVKRASKILTISQFSKNSIVDYYPIDPNRISVAYPGYDKNIFHRMMGIEEKVNEMKRACHIIGKYILFVGTIQPRKNIAKLIDAFEIVRKNRDLTLVLIGKKGWLCEDIFNRMKSSHYTNSIRWLDFVDNGTLSLLYQGAQCFVLPSLYEGFGLPAVEAMASGCPVIVSRNTSLPEVVHDAGVYVDPSRTDTIAEGIESVLENKQLRDTMIRKGYERVKQFDWETCVKETLRVVKSAII